MNTHLDSPGRVARRARLHETRLAKARTRVEELERGIGQMQRLRAKKLAKRESVVPVDHTISLLRTQLVGARAQLEYLEGQS